MKRNRLLIFAVVLMMIASGVNAQYVIQKSDLPQRSQIKQQVYTPVKQERNNLKTGNYAFFNGYNNIVQAITNSENPGSVGLYATPLTNDTTMKIAYWSTDSSKVMYYKPLFMGASCVLDPNTEFFSDYYLDLDYRVHPNAYKIDSIYIRGNYKRPINNFERAIDKTIINGDTTVTDLIIPNGDTTVANLIIPNGDTTVANLIIPNGDTTVADLIIPNGDTTIVGIDTTISDKTIINGDTTIADKTIINGDTTIADKTIINGDTTIANLVIPNGDTLRVNNVVDTLVIELVYGDTSTSFLTLSTNTDPKEYYAAPQWIKDNNAANGMGRLYGLGYKVIKRLLTVDDSILDPNIVKSFPIATDFQVGYNHQYLGLTYCFKSGIPRSYLPTEPILSSSEDAESKGGVNQDLNSFSAAYYSHKDGDEIFYDPTSLSMNYSITSYHYGQKWSGGASFYNYALYNIADMGWDVFYDITGDFNIGIRETENVKIMNAYPNPVKKGNVATVEFELANTSNVSYSIYDIAGKLIMSEDFGKVSGGKRSFEINTNDLRSGIYYYTINAGGSKINNKLMVIE